MGYARAGFEIVGVDKNPMPRYPFRFIQADALEFLEWLLGHPSNVFGTFAAVHASPPCQRWSALTHCRPGLADKYPALIEPTRELLKPLGLPYVIENVPGSPLIDPVTLCATQFEGHATEWKGVVYELQRHRGFEANWFLPGLGTCKHTHKTFPVYGHGHPGNMPWFTGAPVSRMAREVMGADWMTREELAEALPPDYTHYVGAYLRAHLGRAAMALAA
jgi:DNA (cytosine-5)-methyltransferase 1